MSIHPTLRFILRADRSFYQKLCFQCPFRAQYVLFSAPYKPELSIYQCQSTFSKWRLFTIPKEASYRLWDKIKFVVIGKTRLKVAGHFLYESVTDKISYATFFKEMSMPDTFNSWFLVTELHVWMMMVKAMEYGDIGRYIRNFIVQAMWADVNEKAKKLGPENAFVSRMQVKVLADQFQAAMLIYDEGLLTDDKVLASALWRRFFEMNCNDPEKLESMVKYVRQQVQYLANLSKEDFLQHKVNWVVFEKYK